MMNRRHSIRLLGFVPVLILFGCATVGPDYVKPDLTLSKTWHTSDQKGLTAATQDTQTLSAWWNTFNDPELSSLMERAEANNLDLKKASARIREARARRGMAKAAFFPTGDVKGSAGRTHTSENLGGGTSSELYSAGFDAAWELDVFGGTRRAVQAADATLQASLEDRRDVLVTLLAEVALNYLDARTYQTRLAVTEANLKTQDETLQLTTWRYQAGLADEMDLEQARANRESTYAQIPTLRTGLAEAANRLAVLLGEQPGAVHAEIMAAKPIPTPPATIAVGVPADILRQRPDVRKAERNLAAQTAEIGVAKAELYPKFTLNGSIGLEALTSNKLFSAGSRNGSDNAAISWRIFDAGSIRADIKVQTALQEQYLLAYESTVLSALEEVENALVSLAEEQTRKQSLTAATQAAQRASDLARSKYQAGLIDFSDVLIAERSVLSLQDQLAQSEGTNAANVVRLYKAMGGGWTTLGESDSKAIE